jgi:hypothetical protein
MYQSFCKSVRDLLPALAFSGALISVQAGPADTAWLDLFNPKDTSLATNWDFKITTRAMNVDPLGTFKWAIVGTDTVMEVSVANYTNFNGMYGHIGYKHRPFNYYVVRVEHQFWGNQAAGNPGTWAVQNNGIMHHSQSVASMTTNQDFPISLEAQMLGPGNTGADDNSSMNLCTPGTAFYTVATGGSVNTTHCVSATTKNRNQALSPNWAWARAEAYSDSIVKYYFKDSLVYTFYRPVYYAGSVANPPAGTPANNTRLTGGYILLQSESHGTRFRKVQLANLEGCTTPSDLNYKTYFVKHDSTACGLPAGVQGRADIRAAAPMTFIGNAVKVGGTGMVTLEVFNLRGTRVGRHTAQAPFQWTPAVKQSGMHVIRAITLKGTYTEKAIF